MLVTYLNVKKLFEIYPYYIGVYYTTKHNLLGAVFTMASLLILNIYSGKR